MTEANRFRRLPPGSHGIPADLVARNQRERLVAAMAEVCAGVGYAGASATAVAKAAGVSTVTFYKQFADKRECMLAAHRQLLGRLLEEIDRVVAGEEPREGSAADETGARTRTAIRTLLTLLAADPPSARLLTVEILAAGPEGAKRHDSMVGALVERLHPDRESPRDSPALTRDADWVRVAGMLALIGNRVMAGEAARLPELEDELAATLSPQS
jgi:AcrR family transcriptional regulator